MYDVFVHVGSMQIGLVGLGRACLACHLLIGTSAPCISCCIAILS